MKRWLLQESEQTQRAHRRMEPEIVVHYWDGAAPEGRGIRDISETGAYIFTTERWYQGTIIRIILQASPKGQENAGSASPSTAPASPPIKNSAAPDGTPPTSICVAAQVIREGTDGVAMEFVFRNKRERENFRAFLGTLPNQAGSTAAAIPPNQTDQSRKGQALIEFSLIIPLVFLLAVNAVNFGSFIFAWITVAGAARDAAQYMVMSSASTGSVSAPNNTQITALVTNDVTSLKNRSSVVVATCTNNTASANACTTLSDPEAPAYTLATVDVTYTYQPLIPLFSFPSLGISATLPTTTIHRKAVMRMLQ